MPIESDVDLVNFGNMLWKVCSASLIVSLYAINIGQQHSMVKDTRRFGSILIGMGVAGGVGSLMVMALGYKLKDHFDDSFE